MLKRIKAKVSSFLHEEMTSSNAATRADIAQLRQQVSYMQAQIDMVKQAQTLERVEKYLLIESQDPLLQRGITKEFLRSVEIGIHSFCNRTCWFCANGDKVNRRSDKIVMLDEIFLKIIHELAQIGYDGQVSFHRFNEPLADKDLLLKRLSQVNALLPNALPAIYTNGDYLTDSYLAELLENSEGRGAYVYISLYLDKEDSFFDKDTIASKFEKFFSKISLDHTDIYLNTQENRFECCARGKYTGRVTIIVPNFAQHGFTMAGAVDMGRQKTRTKPCSQPFGGLWIDYHGYTMPCCSMRYDVAEHTYATLGNIQDTTIFEMFCGKEIVHFRKQLKNYGSKTRACMYCDMHGEWMKSWAPIY